MPETKDTKITAAKTEEKKAPVAKTEVKKTQAPKKAAAKKPAVKPAAKKPAAKKAAPAKKAAAAAKKPVAKKVLSLDTLTTAIWKKLEKKDISKVTATVAIQVNVNGVGTFYVAVNADDTYKKQVIQADYYLADGIVETSADEIKKIAAGGYKYLDAVKNGALIYRGDLAKAMIITELLK